MDSQEHTATFGGPDGAKELEEIMEQHQSGLLRYATRILRDPQAAQDVVQNTFIKMYQGWKKGTEPGPQMKGWLYRVTHNNAVDHIRKESRLRVLHKDHAAESATEYPAKQRKQVEKNEAMKLALAHLDQLDPSEKQVVVLRVEQGMSYKEIAEITRRTEGNIGCILYNAMKKLAKGLKEAGAI